MKSWILVSILTLATGIAARAQTPPPGGYELVLRRAEPLSEVLQELKDRYGFDFAYAVEALADLTAGPLRIRATDVDGLLQQLFAGLPLDYANLGHREVLLRPRAATVTPDPPLTGRVVDGTDGRPLAGVSVEWVTAAGGTYTDEAGFFRLAPQSESSAATLRFQHLGYAVAYRTAAQLRAQPLLTLQATAYEMAMVTVVEPLPTHLDLSALTLQSTQVRAGLKLSTLTGLLADPLRSLQLLPGISAHNERSAALRIRGSTADETLIVLDGLPLYRAEHLYGVFSAINPDFVDDWTLYKNAAPITYGGGSGGTLLLESPANRKTWGGSADLNLLTAAASLGGPLPGRGELLLAGRTALGNAAESKIFDWAAQRPGSPSSSPNLSRPTLQSGDPDFRFADYNARLRYELTDRLALGLSGLFSTDRMGSRYQRTFLNRQAREPVRNTETFSQAEDWRTLAYGGQLRYRLNGGWQAHLETFTTAYAAASDLRAGLLRSSRTGSRAVGLQNQWSNEQRDQGGRLYLESRGEGRLRIATIGVEMLGYRNTHRFQEDSTRVLDGAARAWSATSFAGLDGQLGPVLLRPALRLTYYSGTQGLYVLPRLTAQLPLSDSWSSKFSYGHHTQFVRTIQLEDRLGQSLNLLALGGSELPVSRTDQWMLGVTGQSARWSFDLEAYVKLMGERIEYALVRPGLGGQETRRIRWGEYMRYQGRGRVLGLDLSLAYHHGGYHGQLAYTLSKATQRFDGIFRGEPFAQQDDRRHQLKSLHTLAWRRWEWSATLLYSSGRPYIDLSGLEQRPDRSDLSPANLVRRLPSYQRIDLGAAYRLRLGPLQGKAYVSVFNLLNRYNVDFLQYIYALPVDRPGAQDRLLNAVLGAQTNLLDRTVNVGLHLAF